MGEMADFYIDRMMDAFPSWSPVGTLREPTRCKHCGATGLKWFQTERGWRLVAELDHTQVHSCEQYQKAKQSNA